MSEPVTITANLDIVTTPSSPWYESEDGDQIILPVHHHPTWQDARDAMVAQVGEEMADEFVIANEPRVVRVHDHESEEECPRECVDTIRIRAWYAEPK